MRPKRSNGQRSTQLRKPDAASIVLCVAFALASLGAVGENGRQRARESVCQANLQQWGRYFQTHIERNQGRFYSGCTEKGNYWPWQLPRDVQDWKKNRTWFCPTATQPISDEHGRVPPTMSVSNAWGVYFVPIALSYLGVTHKMNVNGISGSFGLNGYVLSIPEDSTYASGVPATNGWRDLPSVSNANTVPMFVDALQYDLWPLPTTGPASHVYAESGGNNMPECCINRHDGAVNCLFVDGSVRKVGLKELWTLKWHRGFDTAGPWTKAGGVQPDDWPGWIRPLKDY